MSALLEKHTRKAAATLRASREMRAQGRAADAETSCRLYLYTDPQNTAIMLELGLMLLTRAPVEAEDLFKSIIAADARNANAMTALARLRLDAGAIGEMQTLAERALALKPPAPLLNRIGVLYREAGMGVKAAECFKAAIRLQPDFTPAYHGLAQLEKIAPGSPAFDGLMKLANKREQFSASQRVPLEFTLGKTFLESGDTERAFVHFAEAHRFRKTASRYNADLFDHYVDTIISLSHETTRGTCDSERPIFIIGLPRSGSTLADQILRSHPIVAGLGESRAFENAVPIVVNTDCPQAVPPGTPSISRSFIDRLDSQGLDGIAARYLSAIEGDAPRVTDKMLTNYLWIGVIRRALPRSRIIHCTRDLLDTGLSIWQTLFSKGLMPWAHDLSDIARYMRAYLRVMAHWQKVFPGEIYNLSYEALIADQEGETRRLLEFCGLPWDPQCLEFHKTPNVVKTASASQVRKPLNANSVGKGRDYAIYLDSLIQGLNAPKPVI